MTNKNLATVTNELIESYGNTAKNVINAYRVGNERAVSYVDQSWAAAVKKTGTRLNAEIRSNAVAAQKKVTAIYSQGVVLATDGAELAVNRAVELAGKGVPLPPQLFIELAPIPNKQRISQLLSEANEQQAQAEQKKYDTEIQKTMIAAQSKSPQA